MAKQPTAAKKNDVDQSGEKTMRVSIEAHALVTKLTAHRGLNGTKEFFDEPDVREFFTHLLVAEMEKEKLRLKGSPR